MINYTGKTQSKASDRPQIGRNQAFSAYSPPSKQGQAQPSYGSRQQQGGFPEVPQKGQQSAPDMSVYRQQSGGQSGFRYPSSPPPSMGTVAPPPAEGPVAVQDPSNVQRQIDRLKQMGTWDDPRNAKARERLERQLMEAQSAPPGYFFTPDGRLEPNYIGYLQGTQPQAAAPQSTPTAVGGGYGARIGLPPNAMVTSDFKDGDRDGVDDRYQPGPSQPPTQSMYRAAAPRSSQAVFMPQPPAPQQAPPFSASYGMLGGGYSATPQYAVRDAFISNINDALRRGMSFGTPEPAPQPQLDFNSLYGQAQQMVANGWSNPLAALLG